MEQRGLFIGFDKEEVVCRILGKVSAIELLALIKLSEIEFNGLLTVKPGVKEKVNETK